MALVPDPTTAASERSSVKNRLTGSRRRRSGINRERCRTFSKASLRGSRHRVQAHPESLGGIQAVQGGPGEVRGGAGLEALQPAVKHEKLDKLSSLTRSCIQDCVQEVPVGQTAQGTPSSSICPWLFYQVSR